MTLTTADSGIQLLLNWNTVNIFLFLKGMCLKFKLEPLFFQREEKAEDSWGITITSGKM